MVSFFNQYKVMHCTNIGLGVIFMIKSYIDNVLGVYIYIFGKHGTTHAACRTSNSDSDGFEPVTSSTFLTDGERLSIRFLTGCPTTRGRLRKEGRVAKMVSCSRDTGPNPHPLPL